MIVDRIYGICAQGDSVAGQSYAFVRKQLSIFMTALGRSYRITPCYPWSLFVSPLAASAASMGTLQARVFDLGGSNFSIWCMAIAARIEKVLVKIGFIMCPCWLFLGDF